MNKQLESRALEWSDMKLDVVVHPVSDVDRVELFCFKHGIADQMPILPAVTTANDPGKEFDPSVCRDARPACNRWDGSGPI
jgi:hypothetical protein